MHQRYPKLCLLLGSFLLSYFLYRAGMFDWIPAASHGHGYWSIFLGGILFSFGFTSPIAIAIFLEMAPHVHPLPAAIVGGFGAFLTDFTIFELIRFSSIHQELQHLRTTRMLQWLHRLLHHESVPDRIRLYLLWATAGFVIASPLPDEIGVSILSGITDIESRTFAVLCILLNIIGIAFILLVSGARPA